MQVLLIRPTALHLNHPTHTCHILDTSLIKALNTKPTPPVSLLTSPCATSPHKQVLPIQPKSYNRDFFIFLMALVMIFSYQKHADNK
jgi:hypothetical protein